MSSTACVIAHTIHYKPHFVSFTFCQVFSLPAKPDRHTHVTCCPQLVLCVDDVQIVFIFNFAYPSSFLTLTVPLLLVHHQKTKGKGSTRKKINK